MFICICMFESVCISMRYLGLLEVLLHPFILLSCTAWLHHWLYQNRSSLYWILSLLPTNHEKIIIALNLVCFYLVASKTFTPLSPSQNSFLKNTHRPYEAVILFTSLMHTEKCLEKQYDLKLVMYIIRICYRLAWGYYKYIYIYMYVCMQGGQVRIRTVHLLVKSQ